MWKKKLNIDAIAISLLGCLEEKSWGVWFMAVRWLDISGNRRREKEEGRDRVSHSECVDPRKMQSLSQSWQSWNTLIVHTGQISGGLSILCRSLGENDLIWARLAVLYLCTTRLRFDYGSAILWNHAYFFLILKLYVILHRMSLRRKKNHWWCQKEDF